MSGPPLDADQRELAGLLDAVAADRPAVLDDSAAAVSALVGLLAELGVWTLGTAEQVGGGGADTTTSIVAAERLGRYWPALGWASVQAHAAIDVLAAEDHAADLVARLHVGTAAVAVVDAASSHVRLSWSGDRLKGTVDRVDAAHESPHLLVLSGDSALLVPSSAATATPLRRTGLDGALTRALAVDAPATDVRTVSGADRARVRLYVGASAVAVGIAEAAAADARAYAGERHQFGDVLTAIPTVRHALRGQAGRVDVLLSALVTPPTEVTAGFALARTACDEAIDVAADALQSHGGYGYLAEYAAERRLRDAISLRAAVDTHGPADAAARTLLGLPARPTLLEEDSA